MCERNGGSDHRQVGLPTALEDGHGCKASRSHRHIGKLVGGTVRMDSEELWTGDIDAPEDECSADMSLMSLDGWIQHLHQQTQENRRTETDVV